MENKNEKLDLSIPKTQNTIAITLSRYFSLDELLQINLRQIRCAEDRSALQPCHGMEYKIDFDDDKYFAIQCTLDTSIVPPDHYIKLVMVNKDYRTEINCNISNYNPIYLSYIVSKTSNFIQYRSEYDAFYNRRSIINNIAESTAKVISSIKDLIKLRKGMAVIYDDKLYEERGFKRTLESNQYKVEFNTDLVGIIRVDFSNGDENKFAHLNNSEMGMNILMLIIDKALTRLAEETFLASED